MEDSSAATPRVDRRGLLLSGAAALGGWALGSRRALAAPAIASARLAEPDPTLVVVQLAGGNDGISTIVPFADDAYQRSRTALRVPTDKLLPLDDYRGFHPNLAGFRERWDAGRLAIVEGVGYPEPNLSHFSSFDIWHAASPRGRAEGEGWLAKLLLELHPDSEVDPDRAIHIGRRLPFSLWSPRHPVTCFTDVASYRWRLSGDRIGEATAESDLDSMDVLDRVRSTVHLTRESSARVRRVASSYEPRVAYPELDLASDLRSVAALIQGGIGARVYSVELAGFDTHVRQGGTHDDLLAHVDASLDAFLRDLAGTPAESSTLVLVFSEFGRRVEANASDGTDHGAAGPSFLLGPMVAGGLHGAHPSLEELDQGNLVHTTDFRSLYATVIRDWFGVEPERVLPEPRPTLPLLTT